MSAPERYEVRGLTVLCANCGEPWHYSCPVRTAPTAHHCPLCSTFHPDDRPCPQGGGR